MANLITIGPDVESQPLNDNFAALNSSKVEISDVRGFLGVSLDVTISDFDDITTPGRYHTVFVGPVTNEPYQEAGARRVTLEVFRDPTNTLTMQKLTYEAGTGAGRIYFRVVGETWFEIYTNKNNPSLLSNVGYQKLASGLIIQWGSGHTSAGSLSVTLPIAYPSNHLITIPVAETGDVNANLTTASYTTSGVTILCSNAVENIFVRWYSIGY